MSAAVQVDRQIFQRAEELRSVAKEGSWEYRVDFPDLLAEVCTVGKSNVTPVQYDTVLGPLLAGLKNDQHPEIDFFALTVEEFLRDYDSHFLNICFDSGTQFHVVRWEGSYQEPYSIQVGNYILGSLDNKDNHHILRDFNGESIGCYQDLVISDTGGNAILIATRPG